MRSGKPTQARSLRAPMRRLAVCVAFAACLLCGATPAAAHVFCVSKSYDAADPEHALVQALAAAGQGGAYNAEDNTIRLVRGTYHIQSGGYHPFDFQNSGTHKLDINGGYNSNCSTLIQDPELTILDGDAATHVLGTRSSADVSIRWVTFQNGQGGGNGGALVMNLTGPTSEVILNYNIFRNNVSSFTNGGMDIYGSGLVYIENNLIIGNSSSGGIAALSLGLSDSTVYFINNTIAQNSATNYAVDFGALFSTSVYASNNISWGNATAYDFSYYNGGPQFIDNDYASVDPSSGPLAVGSNGNLNVDPQFVGSGNFHLAATSPLLGAGTLTPPGGLPTLDI